MSIDQYRDKGARRAYMQQYLVSWRAAHPGKSSEYSKRHRSKRGGLRRDRDLSREEDEMRAILRGEE